MKKFWMISILLIAALFMISCGDEEESEPTPGGDESETNGDCTEGHFRCKGTFSQTCDGGKWENFEDCADAGKVCNAQGKCEVAGNGGDDADTGDTGNNGGDSTDTGDTGSNDGGNDSCAEIFSCIQNNSCYIDDAECTGACIEKGNQDGQNKANTMIDCFLGKCGQSTSQEEFNNCLNEQCASEIQACGIGGSGGSDGDSSYKSPYGSLKLTVNVEAIASLADQEEQKQEDSQNMVGIMTSAFATGTYGNGSTSVVPAAAAGAQSSVYYIYETDEETGQIYEGVGIQQMPAIQQGDGYVAGNPLVIMSIDKDAAAVGSIDVSPFTGSKASIQIVEVNWNTNPASLKCLHAFGEGSITITDAGDIANNGPLAFSGDITLYSAKNYKGQDLTTVNDITACSPVN